VSWSAEQVLGLAPDAKAAAAGRSQSAPARWSGLGSDARALWGLCQGSGAKPYETAVDLGEPAFRCSCPSRKFPCKHGLGLMLLWAHDAGALPAGEPPGWAAEWLAARDARASAAPAPAPRRAAAPADPDAAQQRARRREERVAAGVEELERWLADLVRQGLAQAEQRRRDDWEQMAARLVDAQAPGLARQVRRLAYAVGTGDAWPERVLARAGALHLLLGAYRRRDALPPPLRAEVRTLVGWTTPAEEVLAGPRTRDRWHVAGQLTEEDERLRTRRTWLRGEAGGRYALLLDFAAGAQSLPPAPPVGRVVDAEVAFYPGALPLRALIAEQTDLPGAAELEGASVEALYAERARALAANPWLERLPVAVAGVPVRRDEAWALADAHGDALGLHRRFAGGFELLALSGGAPLTVFGEWDDGGLLPLAASGPDGVLAL
jgi:hypothetical protein